MKKLFYLFALITLTVMSCETDANELNAGDVTSETTEEETTDGDTTDGSTTTDDDTTDNEEEDTTTNENDTILLKSVKINYEGFTEVIEIAYEGNKFTGYIENGKYRPALVYNGDKPVKGIGGFVDDFQDEVDDFVYEVYSYDSSGTINNVETSFSDDTINPYTINISYNADNSIVTSTSPGSEGYDTLTIANENVIKIEDSEGRYTQTYTYDNKNSPFKNIASRDVLVRLDTEANFAAKFSVNNVTKEVRIDKDSGKTDTTTYTYTYTDFDYPRTKTTTDSDGYSFTETLTYNID